MRQANGRNSSRHLRIRPRPASRAGVRGGDCRARPACHARAGRGRNGAAAKAGQHRSAPSDGHAEGGADAVLLAGRLDQQPHHLQLRVAAQRQPDRGAGGEHLHRGERRSGSLDLLPGDRRQLRRRIHDLGSVQRLLQGGILFFRKWQLPVAVVQRRVFARRSRAGGRDRAKHNFRDQRDAVRRWADLGAGHRRGGRRRARQYLGLRQSRRGRRRLRHDQRRRRIHHPESAQRHLQRSVLGVRMRGSRVWAAELPRPVRRRRGGERRRHHRERQRRAGRRRADLGDGHRRGGRRRAGQHRGVRRRRWFWLALRELCKHERRRRIHDPGPLQRLLQRQVLPRQRSRRLPDAVVQRQGHGG